ncbi:hypothetical protein SAMN05192573_102353 [Mucilaginibacter gossypii]|uniref:Uncharacterized protein n=1 Tax=Mucilaginibacter gossypii TaxID=551996 RepID=A0A1G7RUT3_9SPHI|nr:hypothetical protein SAMN05192573_102353 [Mucilaginibacter gossypii]
MQYIIALLNKHPKQKRSNAPTADDLKVKLTNKNYI